METIAIIGAGRMGSLLARKLAKYYELIIINRNLQKCGLLSKEIGAIATREYSLIKEADYIITAVPDSVIPEIIENISPFLKNSHIVINVSTDTEKGVFNSIVNKCCIVSAKIIGNVVQISKGEMPLIIIDGEDKDSKQKVAMIFGKVGTVIYDNENIVKAVNSIASEEGIKAAYNIKKRFEELKIPVEYLSFAIGNVACGTMNAFVAGDLGPFAKKIINKLNNDKTDS